MEKTEKDLIQIFISDKESLEVVSLDDGKSSGTDDFITLTLVEPLLMPAYLDTLTAMMYRLTPEIVEDILDYRSYLIIDPGDLKKTGDAGSYWSSYFVGRVKRYAFRFEVSTGARGFVKWFEGKNFEDVRKDLMANCNASDEEIEARLAAIDAVENLSSAATPKSIFRQVITVPMKAMDRRREIIYLEATKQNAAFENIYRKNSILKKLLSTNAPDEMLLSARRNLRTAFEMFRSSIPIIDDITDYQLMKASRSQNTK